MAVEWSCADMTGSSERYQLSIKTKGIIAAVDERGGQCRLGIREHVHELYQLDDWLLETTFPQRDVVKLQVVPGPLALSFDLLFQKRVSELDVVAGGDEAHARHFTQVKSVSFDPGLRLVIDCAETDEPKEIPRDDGTGPSGPPGWSNPPEDKNEREIQQLRSQVDSMRRELEAADAKNAELEQRVQQTEEQLHDEQRKSRELEETAGRHLSELLTETEAARSLADGELRETLAAIAQAQAASETIAEQLTEARERKQELEGRVAQLDQERLVLQERIAEIETLDLAQAQADLDELRGRFDANDRTAELMRGDTFLTGKSVRQMLEQVGDELATVEGRIGMIAAYRETYLGKVQETIQAGNGTLPLDQEIERGYEGDGDGGKPEESGAGA